MSKKIDYTGSMMQPVFTQDHQDDVSAGSPPDPKIPTRMSVTLDNLVPYENNPRTRVNPLYEEIKQSIQHSGLDHPPNVTRQSPSDPYMIRDGGNTRLQILKDLYEETGEERFYRIDCMFYPYAEDIDILAGHMRENEMRGNTLFVERAIAANRFRDYFNASEAKPLSTRELAKRISEKGWIVNHSNLSQLFYAADILVDCIPNTLWAGAGRPIVKNLRKLLGECKKLWDALAQDTDGDFESVWQPAFKKLDDDNLFDLDSALLALEKTISEKLGCPLHTIQAELQAVMLGAVPPTERPLNSFDAIPTLDNTVASLPTPLPKVSPVPATNSTGDQGVVHSAGDSHPHSTMPSPAQVPVEPSEMTPTLSEREQGILSVLEHNNNHVNVPSKLASLQNTTYQLVSRLFDLWDMKDALVPRELRDSVDSEQLREHFGFVLNDRYQMRNIEWLHHYLMNENDEDRPEFLIRLSKQALFTYLDKLSYCNMERCLLPDRITLMERALSSSNAMVLFVAESRLAQIRSLGLAKIGSQFSDTVTIMDKIEQFVGDQLLLAVVLGHNTASYDFEIRDDIKRLYQLLPR